MINVIFIMHVFLVKFTYVLLPPFPCFQLILILIRLQYKSHQMKFHQFFLFEICFQITIYHRQNQCCLLVASNTPHVEGVLSMVLVSGAPNDNYL